MLIKRKVGITSLVKVALSHVWKERQKLQGEVNYVHIFNLYIYKIQVKIHFSFHIYIRDYVNFMTDTHT